MIRELYWLGLGRNNRCSKMVGLEQSLVEDYMSQMRLCFTEAGAYLKYFDEIEDRETRDYIIRARANMALGQFASSWEKIRRVSQTLKILQGTANRPVCRFWSNMALGQFASSGEKIRRVSQTLKILQDKYYQ